MNNSSRDRNQNKPALQHMVSKHVNLKTQQSNFIGDKDELLETMNIGIQSASDKILNLRLK